MVKKIKDPKTFSKININNKLSTEKEILFSKKGKILSIIAIFFVILGFMLLKFAVAGENNNIFSYISVFFLIFGYSSFVFSFFI